MAHIGLMQHWIATRRNSELACTASFSLDFLQHSVFSTTSSPPWIPTISKGVSSIQRCTATHSVIPTEIVFIVHDSTSTNIRRLYSTYHDFSTWGGGGSNKLTLYPPNLHSNLRIHLPVATPQRNFNVRTQTPSEPFIMTWVTTGRYVHSYTYIGSYHYSDGDIYTLIRILVI